MEHIDYTIKFLNDEIENCNILWLYYRAARGIHDFEIKELEKKRHSFRQTVLYLEKLKR